MQDCGGKKKNSKCKRQKKYGAASTSTSTSSISWGVLTRLRNRLTRQSSESDNSTILALLPEDVIFRILTFLPAHVLHNVMIYVCWSWYRLIKHPTFIREHLLLSRSSPRCYAAAYRTQTELHLVIQNQNQGKFQVTESSLPIFSRVLATCDGLLFLQVFSWVCNDMITNFYLANPVTGEKVCLPPIPLQHQHRSFDFKPGIGIAYVPCLDSYKLLLRPSIHLYPLMVLTLGTDTAWRVIDTTYINLDLLESSLNNLMDFPICIDGYIYWFNESRPWNVFALEAQSERLSNVPTPLAESSRNCSGSFLMNSSWLGLADFKDLLNVEVWALKSLEREEWTKMFNIPTQIDTLLPNIWKEVPLHRLGINAQVIHYSLSGEIVLNYSQRECKLIWHDVKTGDYEAFVSDKYKEHKFFYARVNSLVSPRSLITTRH